MSKILSACLFSAGLVLPTAALAQAEVTHGQCVSTFNQTFQAESNQTASENAKARNQARKAECPPPGQAKKLEQTPPS